MHEFAQYGLVGLMVAGMYAGIAWGAKQLLGQDGILRGHTAAIQAVTACLEKHHESAVDHATACHDSNRKVKRLHRAALSAVDEIEQECTAHGIDVVDRCNRVRRELENDE